MRFMLLAACALTGAFLLSANFSAVQTAAPAKAAPAPKVAALDKIAVIGASLSAGFGMDGNPDPFTPSTLHLAHVIDASLLVPHQPIDDQATAMFFMDADGTSQRMLKELRASKPTAIVALDYLFWFGYGNKQLPKGAKDTGADAKEAERVTDLDAALKELGTFTCPLVLADLPDMTPATKVAEPMITKSMVPSAATLKTLNEHIHAFAKDHKNVVLVPLADMTTKLQNDEEITVHGNTWPKGSADKLLQADHLHTTVDGCCAVWILAADAWLAADKTLPATSFELDAKKLAEKITTTAKAAAAAKSEGKRAKKAGG